MPSFSDSIVLFILALLLFGPKRLPALAREVGKWVGEFRRASNEFKMQMNEELRVSEQADRQKEIAAMQAAAPVAVPLTETSSAVDPKVSTAVDTTPITAPVDPLPIATSGEMKIMPPTTGLPAAQHSSTHLSENGDALGGLLNNIPAISDRQPEEASAEIAAHAD